MNRPIHGCDDEPPRRANGRGFSYEAYFTLKAQVRGDYTLPLAVYYGGIDRGPL